MKERNKVANVFTDIAPKWNNKGNLIASCIGQKNPFKTEYKNWIRNGMRILDQTTPNMIQRISGIFKRKPLISKEI